MSGFFGIDLNALRNDDEFFSTGVKSFLLRHITFPVLYNDEISRVSAEDLIKLTTFGLILNRIDNDEKGKLIEFKKNDIKLILLNNFYFGGDRYDMLFLSLFGSTKHFIKPIKLLLRPLLNSPIYLHRFNSLQINESTDKDYDDLNFISNSDSIEEDVFSVVFNLRNSDNTPQLNIHHPLISFLFIENDILFIEQKKLKNKLSNDIRIIMNDCLDFYRNSNDLNLIKLTHNTYTYDQFNRVFVYNPNIFNEIEKIFDKLWVDGKSLNLINKDQIRPQIEFNDFPWFWWNY